MVTSKNVIPAKAGIHNLLTLLDSRLRGSDKLGIIRGALIDKATKAVNFEKGKLPHLILLQLLSCLVRNRSL